MLHLINLINWWCFCFGCDGWRVFTVHLVCLFMKTHLLAVLQDNCLDLVRCAFQRQLSGWVRNITAFSQLLQRPIKSVVLADTDISVKPKWRPDISARPIYRSMSNENSEVYCIIEDFLILKEIQSSFMYKLQMRSWTETALRTWGAQINLAEARTQGGAKPAPCKLFHPVLGKNVLNIVEKYWT